jgi:hypothetical protein
MRIHVGDRFVIGAGYDDWYSDEMGYLDALEGCIAIVTHWFNDVEGERNFRADLEDCPGKNICVPARYVNLLEQPHKTTRA